MNRSDSARFTGRMIAGGLLILVGVLFTLDSCGFLDAGHIFEYWPLILVGVGLARLFGATTGSERKSGWLLIAIGGGLLFLTLDFIEVRRIGPVILLGVGGLLVWQSLRRRAPAVGEPAAAAGTPVMPDPSAVAGSAPGESNLGGLIVNSTRSRGGPDSDAELDEFALMGGGDRVVRSQNFRGGSVTAIMGGFEIDLRGARIAGDSATVDIFTLWGGVEMRVPDDWSVVIQGLPILGAFTNTARGNPGEAPRKTLIVKGAALMGGVEIKN